MDDIISHLEQRIKHLLSEYGAKEEALNQLKRGKLTLSNEREQLINKHQTAVDQIKTLITRLKTIEKSL